MESWTRVIVEWINCLGIDQPSVQDVHDLQDCVFYQKLISQLCHGNSEVSTNTTTSNLDDRDLVSLFIKAEYPDFTVSNECPTGIADELYIASLLLIQCSQKAEFHRPMCVNLKHETQIHIKKFLELVLPYGKNITREIINVAIMEIGDATPNACLSTPIIRPLREFFNSPAARSAHSQRLMNDRNRELRRLKARLETEEFEKADLIEDIRTQEIKIQNLQKNLQEKTQELKSIRNERLKPLTPQSCRKNKRPSDNEERYKRELEQLEKLNLGLQSKIEKVEDEREELARRFTSKDRQYSVLKEKFHQYERTIEAISIQLEMKNNELLDLRFNNEELRQHIREIQKSTIGEQSFEMETINRARSPLLLNSNEALSSIVDIQLQEAKEESIQLKNQLDVVEQRLEVVVRQSEEIKQLNTVLQEKATQFDNVLVSLRDAEQQLCCSAQKVDSLELQNSELIENLAKLNDDLATNKYLLGIAENRNDYLKSELEIAISKNHNFEASLENEKITTANLQSTISRIEEESNDLQKRLALTQDELKKVNVDNKVLQHNLKENLNKLDESENALINEKSRVMEFERLVDNNKKECQDLKILLEISNKSLTNVTEENRLLDLKLQKSIKDLEESQTCLKAEKIKVADLESTVNRVREEYQHLEILIRSREEELLQLNENKKSLEFDLEETKKKLEECEISFNNEKLTVTELESLVALTNKQSEDLKAQITFNVKELSHLNKNNETLELNLQDYKKKLQESETFLKNENTKVAEYKTTLSTLQNNFHVLQKELESNKESLAMERAKVTELELTVARDKKDSEYLKNIVEELKICLDNEKLGTAELKNIVTRSQMSCQELETLLRSKEHVVEESLKRASSLDVQLQSCRLNITNLESSLRSETSRSAELESECSRTKENCAKLEAQLAYNNRVVLEEMEMIKTNRETELTKLNEDMRVMESNLIKLRKELCQMEDEKKQSILANEKIEQYARNVDEKIISLEAKIADYESTIEQLDKAAKVERQNVESLKSQLAESKSNVKELTVRLEETEKRESTTSIAFEATKKKVAELTELGEEVESQLVQERQQLTAIRIEKNIVMDKLAFYVRAESDFNEKMSKIVEELNNANKSVQEQNLTITTLEKNQVQLQDAKCQLENKLAQEQQKFKLTVTDKLHLEQELASYVKLASNMKQQVCKIEKELEDCVTILQKQQETNAALKQDNLTLVELKNKVDNELGHMQQQLTLAQKEKQNLDEELLSHVRNSSFMEQTIAKMEIDFEQLGKNNNEQSQVIEALREKVREIQELKEKLEIELTEERAQLTELGNEKIMLEEEASLYGRSNQDLGNKIVELQNEIKQYCTDVETVRSANDAMTKVYLELKVEYEKMKKLRTQDQETLTVVEKEKKSFEKELTDNAQSQAVMKEEISALHAELEGSRKHLHQLQDINEKLNENITDANAKIKVMQTSETQTEKLSCDLEATKKDCENLIKRTSQLSEELKCRVQEITRAEKQLDDVKREKDIFIGELEERIHTSDNIVASLKKRLVIAEKSCVEAKLKSTLEQEALEVVRNKLEQLNNEKMESELKMKEVILNLQQVRSSQDDVLMVQAKTIEEKCNQLEEAEKELVDLKKLLNVNAGKIDSVKSACREAEVKCEKFKEHNQVQSNLVEELKIALEIEQSKVEQLTTRCNIFDNNIEDLTKLSGNLNNELNGLWACLSKSCPEIVRSDGNEQQHCCNSEFEKISFTVQSFINDAKMISKAVTILTEANNKLKTNMKEIVRVSENLKLELNAVWDCVRSACPQLALPKTDTEISSNSCEISEITYAVKTFIDDAKTIRKAVSTLSEANETLKENLEEEKQMAKNSANETEKIKLELVHRMTTMENEKKNRDLYLSYLVEKKNKLQELLSMAVNKRDQVDKELLVLTDKWKIIGKEAQQLLNTGSSACDELKHLQAKRTELDNTLFEINDRHSRNLKCLLKTLIRIFVWSEAKMEQAHQLSSEFLTENELSEDQEFVEKEISRNEQVQLELKAVIQAIENFTQLVESYEASLKSGAIKRPATVEEKLESQLDKISKERKETKDKLDVMRIRNAKLEKNLDDLRNENKKLKTEVAAVAVSPAADFKEELERFQNLSDKLQKQVLRLQIENEELLAKKGSENQDVEARLKQVHAEYGLKLEKIKQKMKTAYNEQIAKLNQEQEKVLKEKMSTLRIEMEKQCRKYTEDIAKYKAHITDLSSRYWDVGEKLLTETQEKQAALRQLEQLRGAEEKHEASAQQISVTQNRLKTASLDRREFAADRTTRDNTTRPGYRAVQVIEEETTTYSTRRHSVKSIQAMGNAFNAEDEEGEVFDSVYLADLKEGRCAPSVGPDFDRLSELRMRNSMCRPHLKSSYAVETHFQPITLNEDDIKNGVNADDVFNDSLSQSLLPGQKPKKKDRTQTSYKRPGPPTPSKNGGRLSLQGNELKSPTSGVLRERNVERRTTATPRRLKNLFGTSISKRQDENATGTPKGRKLSNIFRKQRTDRN